MELRHRILKIFNS